MREAQRCKGERRRRRADRVQRESVRRARGEAEVEGRLGLDIQTKEYMAQ